MSRGKNCLPTVSRQFLTRNYPRPNCLLKCLPNCLSPTREGFLSSFKINPAVRVIARQVRDKNCLAAIFAPRHQSVSSGPLGKGGQKVSCDFGGGENVPESAPSKPSFGGLRKWDSSGLCPFPLRKMTGREQRGGGKRIISGGLQNRFWGAGLMVCFPLP